MINSVCLCLTFKCDLMCRHCFVAAGPERREEMTLGQITMAIDNSASDCNRMWFSGGEPTVVLDKLLYGLKYAKTLKDKTGFPRNICVQTNGNFAKTKEDAIRYLTQFYRCGANEIDITSNDVFHFEQMDKNIPSQLANLANGMNLFDRVLIGGSDYKVVKRFGRAKTIPEKELEGFDISYAHKCVLTESDLVIHPNGNVLPCIYGFDNVMGNIYDDTIKDILDAYSKTEAYKVLRDGSVCEFISKWQESNAETSVTDICEACNTFFRNLGRR